MVQVVLFKDMDRPGPPLTPLNFVIVSHQTIFWNWVQCTDVVVVTTIAIYLTIFKLCVEEIYSMTNAEKQNGMKRLQN